MRSRSINPDGAEITRLFEAHSDELLSFFARRTFDPQVAFDLLAESFAAAFEARAKCRASSAAELRGWLFGIAHNQLNLFYRDGFIERRALSKLAVDPIALSDESFERVERLTDLAAARERLAGALAELSPEHREVLQLRVVEERSYGDVAECLAVSEQVVRARVSRALRNLRTVINRSELDLEGVLDHA
ncbi:MAG: sigma-70 family RNA polymerase sigma factor [Actinobacteria bacterium]|nr:sigma-70 family RNA polymerase sigma factor [Actinomycetota bacterium]